MDRFSDMRLFVRVVEAGSLSAAAERLEIAKSAASRRLAELETRLGVELLHRSTRRMRLTESGQAYYEHCVRILADVEEAEQSISRAHGALRGRLRVALPLSFGLLQLAPLIEAFMRRHPELAFDLDFNDRQVDLLQEGVDVAIRIANLTDSSLIARRLAGIRHLVCASPDYLAAAGVPRRPADLARHACLVYGNSANPDVWHYHGPTGEAGSVRVPTRLRANNGDMLVMAARAGQGIVMVPTFFLHESLIAGDLVPVLTDYSWPELSVHALYPPTRHLSTRARAFVDYMAEAMAGTPPWERYASAVTDHHLSS
jgi:DNA-binding transcriptional LysR family regulator